VINWGRPPLKNEKVGMWVCIWKEKEKWFMLEGSCFVSAGQKGLEEKGKEKNQGLPYYYEKSLFTTGQRKPVHPPHNNIKKTP